ncbi:MAG: hypothetical protein H0T49_05435 [Chloroflexia bacterium]|nr:hypothetical protein [Chloroflexia bacterium]
MDVLQHSKQAPKHLLSALQEAKNSSGAGNSPDRWRELGDWSDVAISGDSLPTMHHRETPHVVAGAAGAS